jgi:beta-glucosidase
MNKRAYAALTIVFLGGFPALSGCRGGKTPRLGKDPVARVVAAMTLDEKAWFVTGTGMELPGMPGEAEAVAAAGAPVVGETRNLVPGAAGTTYEIPRLGIPAMVMADGPAGVRISPTREGDPATYYCTAFPVATLLASTWDPDLVRRVGEAMGEEALEYGVDILLAPGMNLHRNPLCGRNFEYYSEDPLVTGTIAAAMVGGVQSRGVGTAVKHFAANNAETNRNALDTVVGRRALRELYLEGFRVAIQEAKPWTVMSSYNLINGVHASESHDLLTRVLRDDWGFGGFVMTDWFGGVDAAAQLRAGNDLLMPGRADQAAAVIRAVREKRLEESVLDRNIERILEVLLESPRFKGYRYSSRPDLKAHAVVARQAAAEGMVLLENRRSTLPLPARSKTVAAFGNTSYAIITGGTGSGDVNEAYSVSLTGGLEGAGFRIEPHLGDAYEAYLLRERERRPPAKPFSLPDPIAEMGVSPALAARMARSSDAALITIGRNSGEGGDRKVEADFNLTQGEKELIRRVAEAFHARGKRVIVVLNVGGVIETASWRHLPDAILLAWQGGQETGNSIADVLGGRVNPSGRLASTFPMKYEDVPSADHFPGEVVEKTQPLAGEDPGDMAGPFRRPRASRVEYGEGIYVGYRYYGTFGVEPAYPFGHGLSYTTFEYGALELGAPEFSESMKVTVRVRNAGGVPGREVVQLYLSAPARRLDKPALELKGFAKTRLLEPGESETLEFLLTPRSIASFDPARSSWVAEEGAYTVKVGASARDIRLVAGFGLEREIVVRRESDALAPRVPIEERKPPAR